MYRKLLITTVVASVALCGEAFGSDIYKWVDSNGNVHYVDRPTGNPTEERVDILSRRTDTASVRANTQARLNRQMARDEARAAEAEAAETAANAAAAAEIRREQCKKWRAKMETYLQSRRLYREDEAGERVYLDEGQVLEARAQVQQKITETCD